MIFSTRSMYIGDVWAVASETRFHDITCFRLYTGATDFHLTTHLLVASAAMQPILIGSASEKETLRSNFPEDLECLMTATSDEELVFFVVVATVEEVDVVVRTLERTWMKGRIVHILTPKEFDPKENFIPTLAQNPLQWEWGNFPLAN